MVGSQRINVFNRDGIDLIVDVDTFSVLSVALNCVYKIVNIVVTVKLDVRIVDSVLLENVLDHSLINLG